MAEAPKEYPILWWTLNYDTDRYNNRLIDKCGLPYTCKMTLDHSYYDKSPLVIISQWQMYSDRFIERDALPPKEDVLSGKKAWVLNSVEAPTWLNWNEEWVKLFTYRWTNWFKSDFVESYFTLPPSPTSLLSKVLAPPMMTLDKKNLLRHPKGSAGQKPLAPIAWIVSDCTSASGRRFYVYQLLKYIDIDIYGKCMPNRPWPVNSDGIEMDATQIVAQYKFYLAFENNNCEDYVTEKLERAYTTGAIPIVDGPADYTRFDATGDALVNVDDFSSPKALARHVQELDQDDEKYLHKLRYKIPKDPNHIPNVKDLARPFAQTWSHSGNYSDWGYDSRGVECGICELTHDLAEGLIKLDGTKNIGIDKTCVLGKHHHTLWIMEYYWYITLSVVLGVSLVLFILSRRPVRRFLISLFYTITPTSWLPRRYNRLAQADTLPLSGHS